MRSLLLASMLLLVVGSPLFGLGRSEDEGLKLLRQGLERLERGDYEGALAKFRDAQIERPESREIHFNIGMALYKLERYADARAAFEAAARAADVKIERKSLFHVANCYVKEGKLQEALDGYNRALDLDADYTEAKQNREWVIRKMKELARKQKERDEKAKEERRVIEKLQEIIKTQTEVHGSLRVTMKARGQAPQPSRVAELAQVLDQDPTEQMVVKVKELDDVRIFEAQHEAQAKLLQDLVTLIEEARTKVESATEAGGPTGGGAGDPEIPKLEKALPHLDSAEVAMTRAVKAAGEDLDFIGLHAGQEIALESLLRALDELLDELSRLIKDQALLLTDGFQYARLFEAEDPAQRPDEAALRDQAVEHSVRQKGLRDRAEALAKGMDGQLQQQREQAAQAQAPGGQGSQPGQDPQEALKKLETALGHMNAATDHMEQAEVQLMKPELQNGLDEERQALEELVKARAALQPPPQGGNQKSDQQDENQNQSQDGEQQPQDEGDKGEDKPKPGEQAEPKDSEQKPKDGEQGQDEAEQRPEMSEEQAKKTLDRARQRELDRRREQQDEEKRLNRGGRRRVEKDW